MGPRRVGPFSQGLWFRSWGVGLFGFRKFGQNTKTLKQSRFGQSRSSPRLAKLVKGLHPRRPKVRREEGCPEVGFFLSPPPSRLPKKMKKKKIQKTQKKKKKRFWRLLDLSPPPSPPEKRSILAPIFVDFFFLQPTPAEPKQYCPCLCEGDAFTQTRLIVWLESRLKPQRWGV